MKIVRFKDSLAQKILEGSKVTTWRMFDEKNLSKGDTVELKNSDTGVSFATAEITDVLEKKLKDVTEEDLIGRYANKKEMIEAYKGYYGDRVRDDEIVKMITFKLINKF